MHLEALGAEVLVLQADVAIQAELKTRSIGVPALRRYSRCDSFRGRSRLRSHFGEDRGDGGKVFPPRCGNTGIAGRIQVSLLDFMLLCSSLATIAGGLSKVDYCAANAYLDAVARAAYSGSTFPVISVNWDSWRDVGMAANMAMPEGMGISPKEGAEAFERIVNGVQAAGDRLHP